MKEKVLIFIIGLLAGAVLSTGAFYIYNSTSNSCSNEPNMQMNGGQPPELPDGQEPPEKPDGENGQPPEMPNGGQQNNNQENNK